jgi:hypothetical protein
VLGAALGLGKLLGHTALSCFLGALSLIPLLGRRRGGGGVLLAASVVVPVYAKRVLGNDGRLPKDLGGWSSRLLLDRDQP